MKIYAIPDETKMQELIGNDETSLHFQEAYDNPLHMIEYLLKSNVVSGFQAHTKRAIFWNPATRLFYSVVINSDGCYIGRIGVDRWNNLAVDWNGNKKYANLASAQVFCAFDKNEE